MSQNSFTAKSKDFEWTNFIDDSEIFNYKSIGYAGINSITQNSSSLKARSGEEKYAKSSYRFSHYSNRSSIGTNTKNETRFFKSIRRRCITPSVRGTSRF